MVKYDVNYEGAKGRMKTVKDMRKALGAFNRERHEVPKKKAVELRAQLKRLKIKVKGTGRKKRMKVDPAAKRIRKNEAARNIGPARRAYINRRARERRAAKKAAGN